MNPTTEPAPLELPPIRKKRRIPGYVYAMGFFTLLVVFVGVGLWMKENELAKLEAELDRTDPGWRIEDIWAEYQRSIPPNLKNSFPVVMKARREIPKEFLQWANQPECLIVALSEPKRKVGDPVEKHLIEDAKQQLANLGPALELAHQTRNFPDLGVSSTKLNFDAIGTLLPHVQELREVCAILQLEGQVAALEGDPEKALLAALACIHVARSLGNEPFGIVQLVRAAGVNIAARLIELTLAHNVGSEELLGKLQAKLADEEAIPFAVIHARDIRGSANQLYDHFRTGNDSIRAMTARYGLAVPPGGVPLQSAYFALVEKDEHLTVLKRTNRWVEIARAPEHERLALAKAMPPMPQKGSIVFKLLSALFDRDMLIPIESDLVRTARLRSAITIIACERHRLKTGAWPKSLNEIPKEILPASYKDPFTGEPLKYTQAAGVVRVYSVGADGNDDGGHSLYSLKQPPHEKFDVGIQLLDPNQRRKNEAQP